MREGATSFLLGALSAYLALGVYMLTVCGGWGWPLALQLRVVFGWTLMFWETSSTKGWV